jgi:hypothetical protein
VTPTSLVGNGTLSLPVGMLVDASVSLSETAAVAKLASAFTVNTTTNTITVTAASTYDDLYDSLKAFKTRAVQAQLEYPSIGTQPVTGSGDTLTTAMNITGLQLLSTGTKFKKLQSSGTLTASGALSNQHIIGSVAQATPTNLANVTITGTLTYNTNSSVSITYTSSNIGTVQNSGTGLVTITPTSSTVTTYTDAEINYLDSAITATGITSATIYPSEAARDANTSPGPTFSSILNFKLGSTVSGVVMTNTVYIRVNVSGVTLLAQITLALGENVLDLGVQGQLSTITANLATKPTLAEVEASTVLAKEATVAAKASQTSVNAIPTNPLLTTDARLNNLDATIGSRLASSSYTEPPTVAAIQSGLATEANVSSKASQASVTALGTPMQAGDVVDANIIKVNDVIIDGAGTKADPFGPV